MADLQGKTALITGASRGIGRAVAEALAREGCRVAITARRVADLVPVLESVEGEDHAALVADMASAEDVDQLAASVLDWCEGRLDYLINNAGMLGPRETIGADVAAEFETVMRVNLAAPFQLTTRLVGAIPSDGCIVNVTSSVAARGRAQWGPYAASKAGLLNLTQTWAEELPACVVAINPGGTRTAMRAEALPDEDPSTLPTPESVAPVFVRALKGEWPSGVEINARAV